MLHLVGAVRSMKEFLSSSCCSSVTFSRMWCRWSHGVIIKLSGLIYCQSIGDTGKYIYKMFSNGKIKHFKGIVHTKMKILILSEMKVSVGLLPVLFKKKNVAFCKRQSHRMMTELLIIIIIIPLNGQFSVFFQLNWFSGKNLLFKIVFYLSHSLVIYGLLFIASLTDFLCSTFCVWERLVGQTLKWRKHFLHSYNGLHESIYKHC